MNYEQNVCALIGNTYNSWTETERAVFLCKEHVETGHYIQGKSGSGKSTYMEHLIIDDIRKGRGVTFIDFHGDSKNNILAHIPAHRIDDVIYIDPSDPNYAIGLNILSGIDTDPIKRELYVDCPSSHNLEQLSV